MKPETFHDTDFLNRDEGYLDLPEDYVRELRTLADRYGWTFGIFMKKGYAFLETIKGKPDKKYAMIVRPSA